MKLSNCYYAPKTKCPAFGGTTWNTGHCFKDYLLPSPSIPIGDGLYDDQNTITLNFVDCCHPLETQVFDDEFPSNALTNTAYRYDQYGCIALHL